MSGKEVFQESGEEAGLLPELEQETQTGQGPEAEVVAAPAEAEGEAAEQAAVSGPVIEELREALEQAKQKAEAHWNDLLRARAELDNTRKRAERDMANAHKYAIERFITELLPVKDSLELGLAATDQPANVESLREGIELTLKMFCAVLEKNGVAVIEPRGERFNPELHQAMTLQESREAEPGTVLTVVQKGYLLNDRLIRPAMVVVAKEPSNTEA